ncbi:hypothetical protein [Peptostreptococcus canis]|uniref:Phage protein n=1 Tax=Peptostreptococcus canis TaxID=1159213 RepID=A0ABR6TJQ7_9FIRM|nr:hypothetical protein [Peptostreptococcus canis]MBC2575231.1 hypothetical protein [Peptostreptococcus canis]MBP1997592.1 hypothetical protein [Peptostreptococcus canis]
MSSNIEKQHEYVMKINSELQECTDKYKTFTITDKISEKALKVAENSESYGEIIKKELAVRHRIINDLLKELKAPLTNEQKSKLRYRSRVLISFSIYFIIVTGLFFLLLFCLAKDGYTSEETKVGMALVTGFFVNIIGLVVIIFKYLFDDKNSLMKDMINLITETLKNEE